MPRSFSLSAADYELAERQFDKDALFSALEGIRVWHEASGTGMELNPPLAPEELAAQLSAFGCEIPQELKTLWEWRNGEKTESFVWYHRFLSVEDSARTRNALISELGWPKNWIPVFDFQEEWYFVECSDEPKAATPVGFDLLEDPDQVYAYDNLTRYMMTMHAAMERGVLNWEDEWWGDFDESKLGEIQREMNERGVFPYVELDF